MTIRVGDKRDPQLEDIKKLLEKILEELGHVADGIQVLTDVIEDGIAEADSLFKEDDIRYIPEGKPHQRLKRNKSGFWYWTDD